MKEKEREWQKKMEQHDEKEVNPSYNDLHELPEDAPVYDVTEEETINVVDDDAENPQMAEEESEPASPPKPWWKQLSITAIIVFVLGLTLTLVLCFGGIVWKILLLIEVILIGLFYVLYASFVIPNKEGNPKQAEESNENNIDMLSALSEGYEYFPPDEEGFTLDDIIVQANAEPLRDLAEFIKHPEEFENYDFYPEQNVLLVGEAGSGKSELIQAFANETNLPVLRIHASRFFNVEKLIEKLFIAAQQGTDYIIQLDAFEALLDLNTMTVSYQETILDRLKAFLNYFDNVYLFATCENTSALTLNAGYKQLFKNVVQMDAPDKEERIQLIKEFCVDVRLAENIDFESISQSCLGFSVGEINQLVNEVKGIARKKKHNPIVQSDFFDAFDTMQFGTFSEKKHSEKNLKIASYHEAGHALVCYLLCGKESIIRVISATRADAGGITFLNNEVDNMVYTKEELLSKVCVLYAGRCAEKLTFGHYSTGAVSDILQATSIITNMVQNYGMSDEIGPLNVSPKIAINTVVYESSDMQNLVSQECIKIGKECEQKTMQLLQNNCEKLEKLAQHLIEHEAITRDEMDDLLKE